MNRNKRTYHSGEIHDIAEKLIKRIQKADEVDPSDIESSFQVVMGRVKTPAPSLPYRSLYRWIASVAAIIVIAVGIGALWTMSEKQSREAFDIALLDNTVQVSNDEVTLVTDKSTMNLKDDASLKYDKTGASNAQQYQINKVNQATTPEGKMHQIIVPKGKRANITLADGTKIYVNSGSKVIYPDLFDEDKREILVEGEVYLEVARNENCPFFVKTREFDVKVLGTTFDICAYREDKTASVILVKGSVEVSTGEKNKMKLMPNQLMQIQENRASVREVDVAEYISWKDNLLLIDNKPVKEIFDKLERYYGYKIVCSKEIASTSLTGKLDLHPSIATVMDNLSLSLSIYYSINDEKEIIVTSK